VKKGFQKGDLTGLKGMNPIPGCGGRLSLSFPETAHTSVGEKGFHFSLELKVKGEGKEPSTCAAWMSVFSLDDGYLRERKKLELFGPGSYSTKYWFKRSRDCAHA
jgi:hypothetical protein